MTAPELFARSYGIDCAGAHSCFYCGAPADESLPTSEFVKGSFTERSLVACPGSQWICKGCELCLRDNAELTMLNGQKRNVVRAAMRSFSWAINTKARAGSKADIPAWRELCVNPPEPPFAIVLSDSGQKHLLYRGFVCLSREDIVVTLEMERIEYRPFDLQTAIDLCSRLIAATGKPALNEPVSPRFAQAVSDYFSEWETLLQQWEEIYGKPIARLAAWLSPGRDSARERIKPTADNGLSGVPAQASRPGRSRAQDRIDGENRNQDSGNPSLFDIC